MASFSIARVGVLAALLAGSMLAAAQAPAPAPQPPAGAPPAAAPGGPPAPRPADPRVQQRTYTFPDTNEELPYAVFVSSKVSKDRKAPLIIALHGLGGDPNTLLRGAALDLAEEGGYILVGPMGYNSSGWYGAPSPMAAGTGGIGGGVGFGGPPRGGAPGAGGPLRGGMPGAGGPPPGAMPGAGGPAGAGRGGPPPGAGGPPRDPTFLGEPNEVSKRSEKDVMLVLDMIRKEFNVDEDRMYIMGHSMGGAGAIYLGVKHANLWAGIAAIAPAHAPAGITAANYSLEPAKHVPMMIVQGDQDPLVPVAGVREWVEKMKQLGITHRYIEEAGGDHGSVIGSGIPEIFAFFNQHSKAKR